MKRHKRIRLNVVLPMFLEYRVEGNAVLFPEWVFE